jgi:hypothetical protein
MEACPSTAPRFLCESCVEKIFNYILFEVLEDKDSTLLFVDKLIDSLGLAGKVCLFCFWF